MTRLVDELFARARARNALPGFWMNEATGVLEPAVSAYLNGQPLTETHIAALRAYLIQWVSSPIWMNSDDDFLTPLRAETAMVSDRASIERVVDEMTQRGMDPL